MTAWTQHGRQCLLILALVGVMSAVLAAPTGRKIGEFNFYDSEIAMVLKALSDVGGINIVVGPEVKGRITVTLKDVTADGALQLIAKQANLTIDAQDNAYIVHEQRTTTVVANPDYLVLTLKGGGLTEIKNALAIAFKDVAAQELMNKRLVLTGDKDRLKLAKAFVESLDTQAPETVNTAGATEEAVYQVKTLVPYQVKRYLEDQYAAYGLSIVFKPNPAWKKGATVAASAQGTGPKESSSSSGNEGVTGTKLGVGTMSQDWSSDELVLRGPKSVVEKALVSLTKLDADVPLTEQRCSVKRIYSTQAIAYLLERFEPRGLTIYTAPMTFTQVTAKSADKAGAATTAGAKTGQIGALVHRDANGGLDVAEPLGDFIVRGPADVVKDAVAALTIVDVGPERVEHIYAVRYISVEVAKKRLDELYNADGLQTIIAPTRRSATPAVVENKIDKTATVPTAATENYDDVFDLILRGPEQVVTRAETLLARLDSEPSQIAIGTEILSISNSSLESLGVQWGSLNSAGVLTPGQMSVGMNETQSGDPLKLGMIVRNPTNLNATINLLATQNKLKVINRPTTVVENGRRALIHVGNIITYETLAGYTTTGPSYSTNTLSTGVTVSVKPLQSSDGVITLEISTNVTDAPTFRRSSSGSELPSYIENANTTVVKVHDGETLVIGGLRQTREEISRDEVPVLGRIPLIGNLFRSKKTTPSQSELLVLVTPKVLKSGAVSLTTGTAAN
jgi:type II secretory pathway component GspD/PulD (secretin)